MKTKYLLPKGTYVADIFPIWKNYEKDLTRTTRWTGYVEKNSKMRIQTVNMHTTSVSFVALCILKRLAKYDYNHALILSAFLLHDYPEMRKSKDVLLHLKTDEKDLLEYKFFQRKFKHFPQNIYRMLECDYLLQFAHRSPDCFPIHAKIVMRELQQQHPKETRLFPAMESAEYVFYAYDQYCDANDEVVLTHTLRNQIARLRELGPHLPGFMQEIFTLQYEKWVVKFLEDHTHVPDQREYFAK